jgi:hypothetical protein
MNFDPQELQMSRHLFRAAATGVVALVAGLVTTQSAQADIQTFTDAAGHITSVRVSHGPQTVGIMVHDDGLTSRSYHHFWLDTDFSNPGPEYKATASQTTGHAYLKRVGNFDSAGINIACSGFVAELHHYHEAYVKVIIPRSCMATPAAVRVTVVGHYDEDNDGHSDVVDWAPGERRAYPAVHL